MHFWIKNRLIKILIGIESFTQMIDDESKILCKGVKKWKFFYSLSLSLSCALFLRHELCITISFGFSFIVSNKKNIF
jgi:hypothetical protein